MEGRDQGHRRFLNVDGAALGKTGTPQASGTVIVPVRQLKSGKSAWTK